MGRPAYDAATALVVVDVQNDFADPQGSLYVSGGEAVVSLINDEIAVAKAAGAHVVYTADWHPESTPHFEKDGGVWPVHCVGGTWGAEFHPELVVEGPVVKKGTAGEDGYSGFTMADPVSRATIPTELSEILQDWGVKHLVIVGLATDYCVKATALDGIAAGMEVEVLEKAVRAVNLEQEDGEEALAAITEAGGSLL